jgi:PPOX class probable F420-dependent enzyme
MVDIPESHRYLLDANFLTLATIAPDGRPQVSEVWFLAENGDVKLSLNTSRKKVRNLRDNPKCSVFILDLANPAKYLEVRGDAEIAPDDDYAFAERIGAKYGGVDLRSRDQPGESRVVVTIRPTRVNAVDMTR